MGVKRMIIFAVAAAAATLFPTAYGTAGTATYYSPIVPSACYGYQDEGTMVAAAYPDLYNNGAACGQSYTIQCTGPTNDGDPQPCRGGPITVTIVDLCPGCDENQFDLSEDAFNTIADPDAGKIQIEYNQA